MRITVDTSPVWTGLVGTIGYTIYDADGTVLQARSTEGITEVPAGSGIYGVSVLDSLLAGNQVVWDTGGVNPIYAYETFDDELAAVVGASVALSVWNLAARAYVIYPKVDLVLHREFMREAWQEMVRQTGMVYAKTVDIALSALPGALPEDWRRIKPHGMTLLLNNVVQGELTMATEAEIRAQEVASPTATGTPSNYYFTSASVFSVYPMPASTTGYEVRVNYDANVAATGFSYTDNLPIPRQYEFGLIAYGVAMAAGMMAEVDLSRWWMSTFNRAVAAWREDARMRTETDQMQLVPWEDAL